MNIEVFAKFLSSTPHLVKVRLDENSGLIKIDVVQEGQSVTLVTRLPIAVDIAKQILEIQKKLFPNGAVIS